METRNNQTVAFTGHRKERILQGFGNDPRILAQIREAVAGMVIELYGQGDTRNTTPGWPADLI